MKAGGHRSVGQPLFDEAERLQVPAGAGGRGKVRWQAVVAPDAEDLLDEVFFDRDVRPEAGDLGGQPLRALRSDPETEARERGRREVDVETGISREKTQPGEPKNHPAPSERASPNVDGSGGEGASRRLEQEAVAHRMIGYGTVQDAPRVQLALLRDDLETVASLLAEPGVRRSSWPYLSAMATYLDGLAALGERARVETEASRQLRPDTYLEPFALRALAIVREDGELIERAAGRFEAFGLEWHAARTRALL